MPEFPVATDCIRAKKSNFKGFALNEDFDWNKLRSSSVSMNARKQW